MILNFWERQRFPYSLSPAELRKTHVHLHQWFMLNYWVKRNTIESDPKKHMLICISDLCWIIE